MGNVTHTHTHTHTHRFWFALIVLCIITGFLAPAMLVSIPSANADNTADGQASIGMGDAASMDGDSPEIGTESGTTDDGANTDTSGTDNSQTILDDSPTPDLPTVDYTVNRQATVDTGAHADNVDNGSHGVDVDDVTWHDSFDGSGAAVTGLEVNDVVSGTAPFDKDDEKGNDSSADNDVIRSYDTAVYDIDYTLSSDPRDNGLVMDYYRSARVGFEFLIPADKNASGYKLAFSTADMGWMDSTDGYEATSGKDVVTVNGKDYLSLTGYRLLNAESAKDWVIPGNATVRLVVKVRGAQNGFEFAPIIRAWLDGDDDRSRMVSITAKKLTVSAKLKLNLRVTSTVLQSATYPFNSGNGNATNKSYGNVFGKFVRVPVSVEMRWEDRSKGLRGLEAPIGKIEFTANFRTTVNNMEGDTTPHEQEEWYQPLLWQDNHIWGRNPVSEVGDDSYHARYEGGLSETYYWALKENSQSTTETRSETSDSIDVSTDGYDSNNFPTSLGSNDCYITFASAGCGQIEVGTLSVSYLGMVIPLRSPDGKSLAEYYGSDQTINLNVHVGRLIAKSESGQVLVAEPDINDEPNNTNQSVQTDDHAQSSFPAEVGSIWSQVVKYSCGSETRLSDSQANPNDHVDVCTDDKNPSWGEYSPNGIAGTWRQAYGADRSNGSDVQMPGKYLDVTIGQSVTLGTDMNSWPAMNMHLVKFNPDVVEPRYAELGDDLSKPTLIRSIGLKFWKPNPATPRYMNGTAISTASNPNKVQWYWATKKDGKDWVSVDESKKASFEDLNFYDTYAEAEKHGVVLAAVWGISQGFASNNASELNMANTAWLRLKIRDDAKVGDIAVITGDSVAWSRGDLKEYTGLDAYASDSEWADKIQGLGIHGMLDELYGKVPATYTETGKDYKQSTYKTDGSYNGGDTTGTYYGDTLRVIGENAHVSKRVSQGTEESPKKVYDIDKSERTVDWRIGIDVETSRTSPSAPKTTDVTITDTLPKGTTYIPGSSYLNGIYAEQTPSAGKVDGGTSVEPDSVTVKKDGTTEITWTIHNIETNKNHYLRYSSSIGDTFNPDNDVTNNQQLTNKVSINSTGDKRPNGRNSGKYAETTVVTSKLRQNALAIKADQLIVDTNAPIGYTTQYLNTSANTVNNALNIHMLPSNQTGSRYHGNWTAGTLTVRGVGSAATSVPSVYITTDTNVNTWKPENVNMDTIVDKWTRVDNVDSDGDAYTADLSGYDGVVAYAVIVPKLEPNSGISTNVVIRPNGNAAGDGYVSTWMDDRNSVDAVSVVASRAVNGHVWYDRNGDGVRSDDDPLIPNARITLVDRDNKAVKDPNTGKQIEPVTSDDHGYFQIDGIPAGSGYKLLVQPSDDTDWNHFEITVKDSKDATEDRDSDADAINGANGLTGAYVQLGEFPTVDKMSSTRFIVNDRDTGIKGRLPLSGMPTTILTRKNLIGRSILPGEQFVAVITPTTGAPTDSGNAPINGITGNDDASPAQIVYTADNENIPLNIDESLFINPGTYRYRVTEVDTGKNAIVYDDTAYILTITVTEDMTTMHRVIGARITVDGDDTAKPQDAIVFTNKYTGHISDLPMTGAGNLIPAIILGTMLIIMIGITVKRRAQR